MSRRHLTFAALAALSCLKVFSSATPEAAGAFTSIRLDLPWRAPFDDALSLCVRADATHAVECTATIFARMQSGAELVRFGGCSFCHSLSTEITRTWVGGNDYRPRRIALEDSRRALMETARR